MKIAILDYTKTLTPLDDSTCRNIANAYAPVYAQLPGDTDIRLSIFKRSDENKRMEVGDITIFFHKDDFPEQLRWCDHPFSLHESVAHIKPDIVHMFNLGLPLHFRWLRNLLPEKTKIIGHHTGEHIWIQLRLFLQQFGLRTADGFIFENLEDAEPWLKASVILPRQPVFEIPNGQTPAHIIAKKLNECYNQLQKL